MFFLSFAWLHRHDVIVAVKLFHFHNDLVYVSNSVRTVVKNASFIRFTILMRFSNPKIHKIRSPGWFDGAYFPFSKKTRSLSFALSILAFQSLAPTLHKSEIGSVVFRVFVLATVLVHCCATSCCLYSINEQFYLTI